MKRQVIYLISFFKKAFKSWWDKDPFRESSIIAYYAIFSLPGLLVLVVTTAGYIFDRARVRDQVIGEVVRTLGPETGKLISEIIKTTADLGGSVWAVILGVATILIGATAVFAQFQKSLNIIWEVKATTSKSGVWEFVKVRLFSFGLILTIAFLLMVWLVINSVLAVFSIWLRAHFPEYMIALFYVVNFLVSLTVISLLFALMFKILPDAEIYWRDVWLGAILTGLLFILGELGLGIYFSTADPAEGYGAAGSLILIMLWVSYSSMLVFFGAEFTKVYALHYRQVVPPNKVAKKKTGRVK